MTSGLVVNQALSLATQLSTTLGIAGAVTPIGAVGHISNARQLAEHHNLEIPCLRDPHFDLTDGSFDRWKNEAPFLLREEMRPRFDEALQGIGASGNIIENYIASGLHEVNLTQMIGAGIVGQRSVGTLLNQVLNAVQREVGSKPSGALVEPAHYKATSIIARLVLYGIVAGVAYGVTREPAQAVVVGLGAATFVEVLTGVLFRGTKKEFDQKVIQHQEALDDYLAREDKFKDLISALQRKIEEVQAASSPVEPSHADWPLHTEALRKLAIKRVRGGNAIVVKSLQDIKACPYKNGKYLVVELNSGEFEIRFLQGDDYHYKNLLPWNEKIVGAGYFEYDNEGCSLRLNGASTSYQTSIDGVRVDEFDEATKIDVAERCGMKAVYEIFGDILGDSVLIEPPIGLAHAQKALRRFAIRQRGGNATIISSLQDIQGHPNNTDKYLVVQFNTGEYEIRFLNSDDQHCRNVIPWNEKIVGAGRFEYDPTNNILRLNGWSGAYGTDKTSVSVSRIPDAQIDVAEPCGMNVVFSVFRSILGEATTVNRW